jgi:hypothetical protein
MDSVDRAVNRAPIVQYKIVYMRLLPRIAVAGILGAATILIAAPAHASAGHFIKSAQWSGGYVGEFTIHNHTGSPMNGWVVQFCLPPGTRIHNGWNVQFTQIGDCYTFRSFAWNSGLPAGGAASFGFIASGSGDPINCRVNGEPCDGLPTGSDLQPPTAPDNMDIVWNPGVTLVWDASTDDRGVVGYELFESGMKLRTVTETSYVYSTTNALPPKLYEFGIRAIDAAGNVSPFDFVGLGTQWSATAAPSAPSGLQVSGLTAEALTLSWQASTRIPYSEAPVAGYEVSVDGSVVARVGGTSARLRTPTGMGFHTLSVRAFNAVDLFSPTAQTQFIIN